MPALTDTKPSEVLRGSKALTHGESQAAGDTEPLAAAQLIMPSHPLKAINPVEQKSIPHTLLRAEPGALGHWITRRARKGNAGSRVTQREQAQPRLILK